MERKIIFNKYLFDRLGLKGLKTDFVRIINDKIMFSANVQIEYIYNDITTICIITFVQASNPIQDNVIKKFRGVTKLYAPDIYNKKIGEDNARAKAIIKVEKYFVTILNGYVRLLKKFVEKNNIRKIIVNAFEKNNKKRVKK